MLELHTCAATGYIGLAIVAVVPAYLRIWWLFCAILVFLMQVGFMLVETGFVRERSMSGIALKTFLMLLASSLAYFSVGYSIMYGPDVFHGLIGWGMSPHDLGMEWQFYQTGFAAVAATIISGTIAERTTLSINILIAFIIGGLIYPVVGHWTWANDGGLHLAGFHDLAGSGTVHFLGGIASIAAAWIAGPRLDKYDPITKRISDYVGERSLPMVSCGVIFLWLGWMGFNGGSVRHADEFDHAGFYIIATCCAASAGGFAIMLLSPLYDLVLHETRVARPRKIGEIVSSVRDFLGRGALVRPFDILPATMGGMVAVTASCDLLLPHSYLMAIPIGVCGGVATFAVSKVLGLKNIFRLGKIDDPAEAIAVHGGAGATGILIAAAFSSHEMPVSFYTQLLGLAAIGGFTFIFVAGVFYVLNGRAPGRAPATRTKYYAETFGARVWKEKSPIEEVLGKVHYLFASNLVRSTKHDEHIGLRFEPTSERPAAFPLRTAFVSQELQRDIQEFFSALVSPPVHNLGNTIKKLLCEDDFTSKETYAAVKAALLREIERMKDLGVLKISRQPVVLRQMVIKIREEFEKEAYHPKAPNFFRLKITEGEAEQGEFKVQAQSEILENVVRALFSNAVLAVFSRTDKQEENYKPKIRWELRRDGHRVVLSVIDNGGGVSRAAEDGMFEPFNEGRTTGGNGLGLFYAYKMAEAFGGRLVLAQNGRNTVADTRFDLILRTFEEAE